MLQRVSVSVENNAELQSNGRKHKESSYALNVCRIRVNASINYRVIRAGNREGGYRACDINLPDRSPIRAMRPALCRAMRDAIHRCE